jgi:salicylate hydroxylase
MHTGPGAHVLTYPVSSDLLNIALFVTDPHEWPDATRTVLPGRRQDLLSKLDGWEPAVRGLAALFPPEPVVWGIFDMHDHPAPFYAEGRVCVAGDAAHASAPHHGAGAGFGIEDALAIATAMEQGLQTVSMTENNGNVDKEVRKVQAVTAAFRAFNDVRYERTQWLVRTSRETGDIYEWQYEGSGDDSAKMKGELEERFKVIWDFDVGEMVREIKRQYHDLLGKGTLDM